MKQNIFRTVTMPFHTLVSLFGYRSPMRITEIMIYPSSHQEGAGYYVCPKCKNTLDREFMHFCDRCGQKLNWTGYQNARQIYPRPRANKKIHGTLIHKSEV